MVGESCVPLQFRGFLGSLNGFSIGSGLNLGPELDSGNTIPVARQKAFMKSKNFEKDIAILSATYILDQNPDLKMLIYIIIVMHYKDKEGQVMGILYIIHIYR